MTMNAEEILQVPDGTILARSKSAGLGTVLHMGVKVGESVWDVAPGRPFGPVSADEFAGLTPVTVHRLPEAGDPHGLLERLGEMQGQEWATWANCQHAVFYVVLGEKKSPTRRRIWRFVALALPVFLVAFDGRTRDSAGRWRGSDGRYTTKPFWR